MKVELLHATPMNIVVQAIRKCYDSGDKSDSTYGYITTKEPYEISKEIFILGTKDRKLIRTVIDSGHCSTIEHANFTFDLTGYSRALLQEKSRHRIASVSERSTRYCLGQLKTAPKFYEQFHGATEEINWDEARKYLVFTDIEQVDRASVIALENLRQCIVAGVPNDKAKFCLPDSLVSECIFTINCRSLLNFLELRLSIRALWEIRILAAKMYIAIPEEYKFMFENIITPDIKVFIEEVKLLPN